MHIILYDFFIPLEGVYHLYALYEKKNHKKIQANETKRKTTTYRRTNKIT